MRLLLFPRRLCAIALGGSMILACVNVTRVATLAPSSREVRVTVQTMDYDTQQALGRVRVRLNGTVVATTDPRGQALIDVPTGQTVVIFVERQGYDSMWTQGVLSSDERWTFYLFPQRVTHGSISTPDTPLAADGPLQRESGVALP